MQNSPSLAAKVTFLSRAESYPFPVDEVVRRETHMSWVFLAGKRVYKLKKPVRLPYLDFSTLARRERTCRSELRLNRRLAPDVYLDVVPLTSVGDRLALDGDGPAVDWLVVMRRLDERESLEQMIVGSQLRPGQIDRLATHLASFYRRARQCAPSPKRHVSAWRRRVGDSARTLLHPGLAMPVGRVRQTERMLRGFLDQRADLLMERVRRGWIIDGHGDLRPEHVWLDDRVRIIDCLEFDPSLRAIDPFDEIASLGMECERLGAAWVTERLRRGLARRLRDQPPDALFRFYRCYRALLRARLAAAHLLEPQPRTPGKWPGLALAYLDLAAADADRLRVSLRRPAGR